MPQGWTRVLVALVVVGLAVPAWAQPAASLAGEWRLNAGASDTASGDVSERAPGPQGGRAPMGGGFGGLGGGGGALGGGMRGRAPLDPEAQQQRRALLRELLEPVHRFTMAHDDSAVVFTYADGRDVRYRTHGKTEKHQAVNGTVETETRWRRDRLVRETRLDDGLRLTETFMLDGPDQLVIELTMSGGPIRRAKPVRRVYERAAPEAGGEDEAGA